MRVSRWPCGPGSIFNGAAISRSRKLHLGKYHYILCLDLQWGRDLSIAEIRLAAQYIVEVSLSSMGPRSLDRGNIIMGGGSAMSQLDLQWGRDLSIAEIFTTSGTIASVSGILQWGRDLSIAEMRQKPSISVFQKFFNGAAISRSRK